MVFTRSQAANMAQEVSPARRMGSDARKTAPSKRKLFDAGEERQPEATRSPKGTKSQALEVTSAPPTPQTVDRQRQCESPTNEPQLHPALEPAMVLAMQSWRSNLIALQPRVSVEDNCLLGALALVRALAAARPELLDLLHSSPPHLFTYSGAALWTVCKTCSLRTAIPNRTLMSQACQIHPQALSDFELDLCTSLNWNITKVLRAADLLW